MKLMTMALALICLIAVGTLSYLARYYPELRVYKPIAYASFTTNSSEEVGLPINNWYKQNPWSYVRYYPTVSEILQKNNEAIGDTVTPEMIKTIAISGNFSVALGECKTLDCINNHQRQIAAKNKHFFTPIDPVLTNPQTAPTDSYDQNYNDFGSIEAFMKKPDKSLRRIKANIPNDGFKLTEITEGFNSTNGWKVTKNTSHQNQIFENIEELDSIAAGKLKEELTSMWQTTFVKNSSIKFKEIGKVNDRVVFVLARVKENQKTEDIYFDSITGQVIKMESDGDAIYFDEFKQFNQITLPTAIYSRKLENGRLMWLRVNKIEWKWNEQIDDALFEKPKQRNPIETAKR